MTGTGTQTRTTGVTTIALLVLRTGELMKIFQRVQEIWSGQDSVMEGQTDGRTDGQMDRRTDEGHFYNPQSASRWGIYYQIRSMLQIRVLCN